MNRTFNIEGIFSGIFALVLVTIGVLNFVLVHPVPGVLYLFLSLLYVPSVNAIFRKRFGFSIPPVIKIILSVAIVFFTLGVSDLGDIIDKL